MPPASARTRSPASGSSRAPARSRSTTATARSISRGRCCACCSPSPFSVVDRVGQYDVVCTVIGGGLSGQAGAVRHGISRALSELRAGASARARRRGASSPATAAWSSARNTARPRRDAASNSRSGKKYENASGSKPNRLDASQRQSRRSRKSITTAGHARGRGKTCERRRPRRCVSKAWGPDAGRQTGACGLIAGNQVLIAAISGPTPKIAIIRLRL